MLKALQKSSLNIVVKMSYFTFMRHTA